MHVLLLSQIIRTLWDILESQLETSKADWLRYSPARTGLDFLVPAGASAQDVRLIWGVRTAVTLLWERPEPA